MILPRTFPLLIFSFFMLLGISFDSEQLRADETNFVSAAVEIAQPKMVKVYGASAGRVEGYATGFAVSEDGKILTTQGVFLDGNQVKIVTADGVSHNASILKRDREHQLALLQIPAKTPDYFPIQAEEVGTKGDFVVAVCNAFKVADKQEPLSATLGVISLRTSIEARLNERDVAYRGDLVLIDQITSNPGAAGGAVISIDGQMVGLIGKIINSSETNTRLNYAIPNSVLHEFINSDPAKADTEKVVYEKVDLGIKLFAHGGRNSPAYIDRVKRGSPAHKAKLRSDDLLISLAGEKIGNVKDFQATLKTLRAGEEAILVVKRGTELFRVTVVPKKASE